MSELPEPYQSKSLRSRIALVADSFERLLGYPLVPVSEDVVVELWNAPRAIVAHGTEPDPIFFFANWYALEAFETTVEQFTHMPSRLSAEAPLREERQALLDRVTRDGYLDDYAGVRITATGRRFMIRQAIVWNLLDADGTVHGQAATFEL